MEITRNIRHPEYSIQHSRRGFSYVGAASRAALPRRPRLGRPTSRGFTLIELLVVITIIGILASLITVAAIGALKAMRETEIKTNVSQLDTGMMEYKNKTTAFPPNCQTDGTAGPLDDAQILSDLKKHLKQAFPRHQEPDDLIRVIAGFDPANTSFSPKCSTAVFQPAKHWCSGWVDSAAIPSIPFREKAVRRTAFRRRATT